MSTSFSLELKWKADAWQGTGIQLPVDLIEAERDPVRLMMQPNEAQAYRAEGSISVEALLPSGRLFRRYVRPPSEPADVPVAVSIEEVASGPQTRNWIIHQALGTLGPPTATARPISLDLELGLEFFDTLRDSKGKMFGSGGASEVLRVFAKSRLKAGAACLRIWRYQAGEANIGRESGWVVDEGVEVSLEPYLEAFIVHLRDDRFQFGASLSSRPHRLVELFVGESLSRFTVLPPVAKIQLLVRASNKPANAQYAGGLTMKIVPFEEDGSLSSDVQWTAAYMNQGAVDEIRELAQSLVDRQNALIAQVQEKEPVAEQHAPELESFTEVAESALANKRADPYAAALAGYYLILTNQFDAMGVMPRNFARWVRTMPDTSILYAWQLMTAPQAYGYGKTELRRHIRQTLVESAKRGIPLFTMGLRFLFQRLRLLEHPKVANEQPDVSISNYVEPLEDLLDASDAEEFFTTFFGLRPWLPTRDLAPAEKDKTPALPHLPAYSLYAEPKLQETEGSGTVSAPLPLVH